MAFTYYSPISINAAQVPSTQTDFPVLVSQTDARFKTVGNGGHVQNSSGFDIRPYSDSGLTTAITGYALERYNATTGEVVMFIKVGSLSSSTTPIYLAYGNASLTTDGSSTTTFSNNYLGVYPLQDGTTLIVGSSTGSNNGTNSGATATSGMIDGGAAFFSASIALGTAMNPSAVTYAAWVNPTSFPAAYVSVISRNDGSFNCSLLVKSTGKMACYVSANAQVFFDPGSHTLSTGTWYHLVMTYDSSAGLIGYVNGASDGTAAANGTANTNAISTFIGSDPSTGGRGWNGKIDQVTISSVARSANWITTEYNNQSAPGTFETLGTEVSLGGAVRNSNFLLFF